MKRKLLENIPNIITCLRILAAAGLVFAPVFSVGFYVLLTFCGASDVADGCIARRLHLESVLGAKLDSVADLLFWGVTVCKVLPVIAVQFRVLEYAMLLVIFILRVASYAIALMKYRCFPSLHTYLNKLTGFALFISMYLLNRLPARPVCIGLFLIALAAALEEIWIHLHAKQMKPNTNSAFSASEQSKTGHI